MVFSARMGLGVRSNLLRLLRKNLEKYSKFPCSLCDSYDALIIASMHLKIRWRYKPSVVTSTPSD